MESGDHGEFPSLCLRELISAPLWELSRVCRLAHNAASVCEGPFNSWDRQVWEWMDDSSGVPTKSIIKKYDEIKGNFFIGGVNVVFYFLTNLSAYREEVHRFSRFWTSHSDVQATTMARRRSVNFQTHYMRLLSSKKAAAQTTTTAPRITTRTTSA